MRISIELNQTWHSAGELSEYLRLLSRTLERIVEMEADCPEDWYLSVERGEDPTDHNVFLTHL